MHNNSGTFYKDLVLVGGGHSHALVLKMWAMNPIPGVRLTLISPTTLTPYSGMLPGLISGNYSHSDAHIDLMRLCQFANARFIQESVTGLDLEAKKVLFTERPPLTFDLLSINSGITPDINIEGAKEFSTPVKPIAQLYPRWRQLEMTLEQRHETSQPFNLAVVGGGAAGVELIFAFHSAIDNNPDIGCPVKFHLIHKGQMVPEGYPAALQRKVTEKLNQKGIQLHTGCVVNAITPKTVQLETGADISVDSLFWCTQAKAANWPSHSGLATDEEGFIAVNACLQSISHDFIFAAGDIAHLTEKPCPKAGVYAVRQAPILFQNLRRSLLHRPLKKYRPQSFFLSLLVCGGRWAIGCRTGTFFPVITGHWVWRWKDRIDRKFMAMFNDLSTLGPMPTTTPEEVISGKPKTPVPIMRCGGCGAKVGTTILQRVMNQLQPITREDVVIGLHNPDDASAIRLPKEQLLVQSVDVLKTLVDDPYLQGKIAAEHALSDIFAMNATAHSALAIVTLPYGAETIVESDLLQLMSGAVEVLNLHGCALIGGHTSEGAEMSIGFSVNAFARETDISHKAIPYLGHKLILTQPLGSGALFAAHRQLQAKGPWLERAIRWMVTCNKPAAEIFSRHQASACTDVTGFGLVGHLLEMLKPHQLRAHLHLSQIPVLNGAVEVMERGITSTLQPDNLGLRQAILNYPDHAKHSHFPLLFDPQTSGGLLGCVPSEEAEECLSELREAGYSEARIIGEISSGFPPTDTSALIELSE